MENTNNKTQQELIGIAFRAVNAFKRHRALEKIKKKEGDYNKSQYHSLKQYELFDELELALRAIQRNERMDKEDENE